MAATGGVCWGWGLLCVSVRCWIYPAGVSFSVSPYFLSQQVPGATWLHCGLSNDWGNEPTVTLSVYYHLSRTGLALSCSVGERQRQWTFYYALHINEDQ